MMVEGRSIVCLGFGEWDAELWTNQQHLMSRLARRNRVLFLESLGLRQPRLAGRDLSRMARRARRALAGPRAVDGLHVLSPLVVPLHGRRGIAAVNAKLLRAQVGRAARSLDMERPLLWSYVPQAEWLVEALDPAAIVYHCVDDIAAQKGVRSDAFRVAEARFAARADLVLASAPALAERMRTLNERVVYAPNVADTERFATALDEGPTDPALDALPHPRIVFTGAVVATKLDLDLLEGVAQARPDWSIALVGPVGAGDPLTNISRLRRLPNVHLLGSRPYDDVAGCPARRRRRARALRDQRPDPLGVPDEGVRVPGRRPAGGDHAAARPGRHPRRGRGRGRSGHDRRAGARAGRRRARRAAGALAGGAGQLLGSPARRDRLVSFGPCVSA